MVAETYLSGIDRGGATTMTAAYDLPRREVAVATPFQHLFEVIVDSVGAATWEASLRCHRKGGRLVTCGATTAPIAPLDIRFMWRKQINRHGATMANRHEFTVVRNLPAPASCIPWWTVCSRSARPGMRSSIRCPRTNSAKSCRRFDGLRRSV